MKAGRDQHGHYYILKDDGIVLHINVTGSRSTHINTIFHNPFDNPRYPHMVIKEIPISEAIDALHKAIAMLDIEELLTTGE